MLSKAVARHRAELGNQAPHWTPHDLRRTCRTGLAAAGVSDEIAERVVGHVRAAMVDTYNTHQYVEEKRRALLKWQNRLERVIGAPVDNVIELRS